MDQPLLFDSQGNALTLLVTIREPRIKASGAGVRFVGAQLLMPESAPESSLDQSAATLNRLLRTGPDEALIDHGASLFRGDEQRVDSP
jgi:hypothetical protein